MKDEDVFEFYNTHLNSHPIQRIYLIKETELPELPWHERHIVFS